jgi:hypothetical protein
VQDAITGSRYDRRFCRSDRAVIAREGAIVRRRSVPAISLGWAVLAATRPRPQSEIATSRSSTLTGYALSVQVAQEFYVPHGHLRLPVGEDGITTTTHDKFLDLCACIHLEHDVE